MPLCRPWIAADALTFPSPPTTVTPSRSSRTRRSAAIGISDWVHHRTPVPAGGL